MKVRKLAVALALAGGLGSGVAQALGLGEVELQSYLNEPLNAEIALRKTEGIDPENIIVELASKESYDRLGIDRDYFLTNLRFSVESEPGGGLVVNVTSRQPVREPYLNFLLKVTWPSGRVLREYSVLVDPPVYAEESGVREQIQAPSESAPRSAESQGSASQSQSQASQREQRSEPAQTGQQRSGTSRTYGPTQASDTLWTIAVEVRPDSSVTTQQVMLALQDLNPDAFMDGNINRLKRGQVLRTPTLDQVQRRSRSEANRQVAAQNEAFSDARRTVDARAGDAGGAAAEAPAQTQSGDELRLIAADESAGRSEDEGGSAGGAGSGDGADNGQAVALEELDRTRRENEELSSRLDDMQEQVATLQRLIELKNSQLAEMQQAGGEQDPAGGQDAPDEQAVGGTGAEAETDDDAAGGGQADDSATAEQGGDLQSPSESEAVAGTDEETGTDAETGTDVDAATDDESELASDEVSPDSGTEAETVDGDGDGTATSDAGSPAENGSETTAQAEPDGQQADSGTQEQEEVVAEAPAAAAEPEAAQSPAPAANQPEPATKEKGFPGNIIDAIASNPLYQAALGGGLVLLLLLLLFLARRNANREKAFYEQLNSETAGDDDHFALSAEEPDGHDTESEEGSDPLADADVYIAYGRLDQAAQSLESAISREPSRTDLRLKLLGVYADSQDREAFEKQLGELEALEDEHAIAEAVALRSRLEEAESRPSIDDLESQLRSDSYTTPDLPEEQPVVDDQRGEDEVVDDTFESAFEDLDLGEEKPEASEAAQAEPEADSDKPIEFDLSGFEDESDLEEEVSDKELEDLSLELEKSSDETDFSIDFDSDTTLDEANELVTPESEVEDRAVTEEPLDLEDEFASLDLEEAGLDNATGDDVYQKEPTPEQAEELVTSEDGSLDESFLDELDAELDKVAGEDTAVEGSDELSDESLDDLELDVSDEDLALMEEVADSGKGDRPADLELDDELGLDEALDAEELEESSDLDSDQAPLIEPEEPESLEPAPRTPESREIDDSELGEEDDFDFLSGTDEAATKLDLARAYVEMGDADGARDILEEVAIEGTDEQKAEAKDMLNNLG
ncbi:FimV/HubP family polar landmark protein [Marinobacter salicampi]|uniref:FimV/HubP family polar landmark protein n=1 Tax=Marinobacter salicampi TaxID=435907 RepID=UPI00140AF074|nr:FimV/HubP family polar landmark protein [Marinobacter salicampi]